MARTSLEGRHALVCGASRGIGRAAALALAARGASITALARSADRLEALIPELRAAGAPDARALVADLDDHQALAGALDQLLGQHGAVHVVINNTGGPPGGPLSQASPKEILAALHRHLLSAHLILQRTLPGMAEAGYGRFVQVLSTSVREPIDNLGVSNLTRAAVASWAKTLSQELPSGVTINNVLPGFTDTERLGSLKQANAQRTDRTPEAVEAAWLAGVPEGRLGRPEELGAVIAFLASPEASYVRGTSIPVDGGRLRSI
ncbi:MAG TPA: SDR family oxidoreductase [Deltaproteobacteria bacterium]|nr:SDR family oxidoreductase [Deltaproteobacteria bacterium]